VNVDAALEAGTQFAEGCQPGVGSFDHPAMAPEPVVTLDAFAGNTILDTAALEVGAASGVVIALVRMQLAGPVAWPARFAAHSRQGIDQLLKDHRIMAVGPGDAKDQRDALAVRDDVALAAEFSPVRGVGPRVRAPRGLGTLAPSTLARLKSSLSALRSSASNARCRRCHTPAACQSRSRLQQVMPLPKPNSWGRCSQGVPVRSTNRMPFKASSSLNRGLPPLGEGFTAGSNGSILLNSAVLISLFLFLAMPYQTHIGHWAMTGFC